MGIFAAVVDRLPYAGEIQCQASMTDCTEPATHVTEYHSHRPGTFEARLFDRVILDVTCEAHAMPGARELEPESPPRTCPTCGQSLR